jgi:hypothetical protein
MHTEPIDGQALGLVTNKTISYCFHLKCEQQSSEHSRQGREQLLSVTYFQGADILILI